MRCRTPRCKTKSASWRTRCARRRRPPSSTGARWPTTATCRRRRRRSFGGWRRCWSCCVRRRRSLRGRHVLVRVRACVRLTAAPALAPVTCTDRAARAWQRPLGDALPALGGGEQGAIRRTDDAQGDHAHARPPAANRWRGRARPRVPARAERSRGRRGLADSATQLNETSRLKKRIAELEEKLAEYKGMDEVNARAAPPDEPPRQPLSMADVY
jgi:hypothetical protein